MKLYSLIILTITYLSFVFSITINDTWEWSNYSKNYNDDNICRRTLFKADDKIFTLLAFPSLFLSFNLIIVSSYLFAITMTEVRNAVLNTEDVMLQVMDSVLVCLMPANIINRICATDAKIIRYEENN